MSQELVRMTKKEVRRVEVLSIALSGGLTNKDASELLGVCVRQFIRIKKKFLQEGAQGLVHGNRGRNPVHAITDEVRGEVVSLFKERYYDFNISHFTEHLNERECISISRSSVSRILKLEGIRSKRSVNKKPKAHRPRQRKESSGMLWQTDASSHKWFGKDGDSAPLHAFMDDAAGIVTGAFFIESECFVGYAEAIKMGIRDYGLPLYIYSDRHTIFKSPKELTLEDELKGVSIHLSNFGHALNDLGIKQIFANTPQAKGRIERLWNTFQDRLAAELRLNGIRNIEEANSFLPLFLDDYNARFSVEPKVENSVYLKFDKRIDLDLVFVLRCERKIGGGNTISYNSRIYIPVDGSIYMTPGSTVEVRQTVKGEIYIMRNDRAILMKQVEMPKKATHSDSKKKAGVVSPHKPASDHPWRGRSTNVTTKDDTIIQRNSDIFFDHLG